MRSRHSGARTIDAKGVPHEDPGYPAGLNRYLGQHAPAALAAAGNLDLLRTPALALFCSTRCPGSLILRVHDLAIALREAAVPAVGGFHTPLERECLRFLLRGRQPVIICPARGIDHMRIPSGWREPLDTGRLLILSPFPSNVRRAGRQLAEERNRVVAALAERVLIVHAAPGGKTEQLCHQVVAWGKPLFTLDDDANAHLIELGAIPLGPAELPLEI